ncbi:hypothetical protein H8356DRAFT_1418305 [Neocallimastix lanati (nom. inval.)]|nr:hypothetical protein H8356DRAFT_1418305 [Neocallimastix sp. JGI-2020a]
MILLNLDINYCGKTFILKVTSPINESIKNIVTTLMFLCLGGLKGESHLTLKKILSKRIFCRKQYYVKKDIKKLKEEYYDKELIHELSRVRKTKEDGVNPDRCVLTTKTYNGICEI